MTRAFVARANVIEIEQRCQNSKCLNIFNDATKTSAYPVTGVHPLSDSFCSLQLKIIEGTDAIKLIFIWLIVILWQIIIIIIIIFLRGGGKLKAKSITAGVISTSQPCLYVHKANCSFYTKNLCYTRTTVKVSGLYSSAFHLYGTNFSRYFNNKLFCSKQK